MVKTVRKRDGREMQYSVEKIASAVQKAMVAAGEYANDPRLQELSLEAVLMFEARAVAEAVGRRLSHAGKLSPGIEEVQDAVEAVLTKKGLVQTVRAYIVYRAKRSQVREMDSHLMRTLKDITHSDAEGSDLKRENANIDGDSSMGTMLKYGSESAKHFYMNSMLKPEHGAAHKDGDIHIHDLDFYSLTMTCCQIDIKKLFEGGFGTGHGHLREPKDIRSYAALAAIAVQSNQNDQHGGQSIPNFDYAMADGVRATYAKSFWTNLERALRTYIACTDGIAVTEEDLSQEMSSLKGGGRKPTLVPSEDFASFVCSTVSWNLFAGANGGAVRKAVEVATAEAYKETDNATYQAMEAFVHNLNSMHSRAGAQVPFSSINYGTCVEPEARMAMRNLLLATEAGLGNGETAIFPIQVFRVQSGVNLNEGDVNYDLFKLACRVSAKRLFPNFSFQDAPFNMQYYKPGHPETEIATMGCRTRVIGNTYDTSRQTSYGRGNLSFSTINLPRLAIKAAGDLSAFYSSLNGMLALTRDQLLERFEVQCRKKVKNYPFLMGQGVWIDSEKLGWDDEVREVIKHGTLSIGFIGLAEALVSLTGKHHGESEEAQVLGLEIISRMRGFCDAAAESTGLNFSLLATPAEGLSGRFVRIDRKRFGSLPGITDRDYYTNSFHVPVYHSIRAIRKIELEAPYHALTNAGHISYVEMDADPSRNLEAFEKIVRAMHAAGIGYGSINHPVDRHAKCGFSGIIEDECPRCGAKESDGASFERLRRITGYLVGSLERFNDAKRAEEADRVKHG